MSFLSKAGGGNTDKEVKILTTAKNVNRKQKEENETLNTKAGGGNSDTEVEALKAATIVNREQNEKKKTLNTKANQEIPIIPFSSVILLEAENSNELEPWRRKFGKDCNKVAATGSRPLKCPICPSFFTKLSISEFKSHMIRGKSKQNFLIIFFLMKFFR